jgi:hypothetical protein
MYMERRVKPVADRRDQSTFDSSDGGPLRKTRGARKLKHGNDLGFRRDGPTADRDIDIHDTFHMLYLNPTSTAKPQDDGRDEFSSRHAIHHLPLHHPPWQLRNPMGP